MIAIVGSGLAGLTAARELLFEGFDDFLIFDKSDHLGGRVRTRIVDHYLIDEGFQVLNPKYQILDSYLDTDTLQLGFFDSGAMLLSPEGSPYVLVDPLQDFSALPNLLFGEGRLPLKDLISAAVLRLKCQWGASEPSTKKVGELQLREVFESGHFSEEFLLRFLKPFFAGVLLTKTFDVPYSYFEYLYGLFGKSRVGLPKNGMSELAHRLAKPIPASKIRLKSEIKKIEAGRLVFDSGKTLEVDGVLLALDAVSAQKVLELPSEFQETRSVLTVYFSAPRSPWGQNLLGLLPWGSSLVNHISLQSKAQPSYAPSNRVLISANIVDPGESLFVENTELEKIIIDSLRPFSLQGLDSWSLLEKANVRCALPAQFGCGSLSLDQNNLIVAGDFLETPSIGGAMLSGQKAAHRLLKALGH